MTPREYITCELCAAKIRLEHAKKRNDQRVIHNLREKLCALKILEAWCREKEDKHE